MNKKQSDRLLDYAWRMLAATEEEYHILKQELDDDELAIVSRLVEEIVEKMDTDNAFS